MHAWCGLKPINDQLELLCQIQLVIGADAEMQDSRQQENSIDQKSCSLKWIVNQVSGNQMQYQRPTPKHAIQLISTIMRVRTVLPRTRYSYMKFLRQHYHNLSRLEIFGHGKPSPIGHDWDSKNRCIEIKYSETCLMRKPRRQIYLSALDRCALQTVSVCEIFDQ